MSSRKPGVATDEEFDAFLAAHDRARIIVVDARNPDFSVEPDDEAYGKTGSACAIDLCGTSSRPRAINAPWNRAGNTMDASAVDAACGGDLTTPIITHCGGGGRGEKAKQFLLARGYTNVANGGGPSVKELWEKFGSL